MDTGSGNETCVKQQPDYNKAERLASDLLEKYALFEPPILSDEIARKEGLMVYSSDFSALNSGKSKISGYVNISKKAIYIDRSDTQGRQNFTIAHELGHWLLGHASNEFYNMLYRQTNEERRYNPQEQEANAFAASLLMPEKMVKYLLKKFPFATDRDLATVLSVSEEAFKNRKFNLIGYAF